MRKDFKLNLRSKLFTDRVQQHQKHTNAEKFRSLNLINWYLFFVWLSINFLIYCLFWFALHSGTRIMI